MQDGHIATCLTAQIDGYGRTWILVFNEVLWFGLSMDHSLINTNKIQMIIMLFLDELFDENWKLAIYHKRVIITCKTDVTAVYFD